MLEVFTKKYAALLTVGMGVLLPVGIVVIYILNDSGMYDNCTVRKMFHLLSFWMFMPGLIANVSNMLRP